MKPKIKQLDFTLETDIERRSHIKELLKDNPNPSNKILELYANYILYGKDEKTGNSVVDDKKVEISTKYSSYANKTKVVSLEKLLTDVNNNETVFCKQKYSKPKISIDRVKDANIPNIKELWKTIDALEDKLKNDEKLTDLQKYHLKHKIIELRREQYSLKDCFTQTRYKKENFLNYFPDTFKKTIFKIEPRGLYSENGFDDNYAAEGKRIISFTNIEHIKKLIAKYDELIINDSSFESTGKAIKNTLKFYVNLTNINIEQALILTLKTKGYLNKDIAEKVNEKFGVLRSQFYISKIYKNILEDIAFAAEKDFEMSNKKYQIELWKPCSICGEELLRTDDFFHKKKTSQDGLTNYCKRCDRKKRFTLKQVALMSAETLNDGIDLEELRKMKIHEVKPKLLMKLLLEYVEEKDLLF